MSDRLRGQKSKATRPFSYSTGGPWRGKSESHVADSKRGLRSDEPARSVIHASNLPKGVVGVRRGVKDARSGTPARWGTPYSSHALGGAVLAPKRSSRQPVSPTKRGKRK